MKLSKKILVIGGGAAGLLFSIVAKRAGNDVTILEKNDRVGKKILATGNGRCNFTNRFATPQDYSHPEFVNPALSTLDVDGTLAFFQSLGVESKLEEEGRMYPYSEQASSILDCLLFECLRLGVEIVTSFDVISISKGKKYIVKSKDQTIEGDAVLLSTGGKAMPKSGSTGSGYLLAKHLGHSIVPAVPSLSKLSSDFAYLKHLDGLKVHVPMKLYSDKELRFEMDDDVLFTSYGLSGPAVMDASKYAGVSLLENRKTFVELDLCPTFSEYDLMERFRRLESLPVDQSLIGLVHKRLIIVLLKEAQIQKLDTLVSSLTKTQLSSLLYLLKHFSIRVTGVRGFDDAQVTSGGVNIHEVNPETMESKLSAGLYFAGELLDIDARCGGYNLQWAWSSAYLAALAISRQE